MPKHYTQSVCVATLKTADYETHWITQQYHKNSTAWLLDGTIFFSVSVDMLNQGKRMNSVDSWQLLPFYNSHFNKQSGLFFDFFILDRQTDTESDRQIHTVRGQSATFLNVQLHISHKQRHALQCSLYVWDTVQQPILPERSALMIWWYVAENSWSTEHQRSLDPGDCFAGNQRHICRQIDHTLVSVWSCRTSSWAL